MTSARDTNECEQWLSSSLREWANRRADRQAGDPPPSAALQPFLEAIYAGHLKTAEAWLVQHRVTDTPGQAQVLDWILPAIYEVERNWASDSRSYTDTLRAFWHLQKLLHDSAEVPPPAHPANVHGARNTVVLAAAPGSEHTFGTQVVDDHFRARGWTPRVLLQTTAEQLKATLRDGAVDVLGLSVGHDAALAGLSQLLMELRAVSQNPQLRIMLGGNIFSMARSEYDWLGADCIAQTAEEAFNFCQMCSRQRLQ